MEVRYPIFLGQEQIGEAKVIRQGLYDQFFCRCKLSGEIVHRLVLKMGNQTENLGILVPNGAFFELTKKLPVSRVGKGPFRICAVPRHTQLDERFIPLIPDEPFSYLHRLNGAYLAWRDGQIGVIIKV